MPITQNCVGANSIDTANDSYSYFWDSSSFPDPAKPNERQAHDRAGSCLNLQNQQSSSALYAIYRLSANFEFQDRDYGFIVEPIPGCFKNQDSVVSISAVSQCQDALKQLGISYTATREVRSGKLFGFELDILAADTYKISLK